MRTEQEVRELLRYIIDDCEGGRDPFTDQSSEPAEWACLYCRYIRMLKWMLGETEEPYIGSGMQPHGVYSSGDPPDFSLREQYRKMYYSKEQQHG